MDWGPEINLIKYTSEWSRDLSNQLRLEKLVRLLRIRTQFWCGKVKNIQKMFRNPVWEAVSRRGGISFYKIKNRTQTPKSPEVNLANYASEWSRDLSNQIGIEKLVRLKRIRFQFRCGKVQNIQKMFRNPARETFSRMGVLPSMRSRFQPFCWPFPNKL